MTDIPFNRRLFHLVLWVFSGLCLLILLTSCVDIDQYIQPVATADQKWRAPSAVPSPMAAVSVYQTAQAENEYCPAWAKISPARERWVCFKYLTIGE
jgi:hypothetical protein